ncbi:hypothetical protein DDE82_006210 [Stemphylium lycopersici]|nr:hypothetical protein TW65_00685 [Stemphylium lycopersici]RAR01871.1 hypothetical protein DDE82_006210 [Stemphylium lycopersici]
MLLLLLLLLLLWLLLLRPRRHPPSSSIRQVSQPAREGKCAEQQPRGVCRSSSRLESALESQGTPPARARLRREPPADGPMTEAATPVPAKPFISAQRADDDNPSPPRLRPAHAPSPPSFCRRRPSA